MADIHIKVDDAPEHVRRSGPQVGDVYRKTGGPAGFMVIVSNNGSTHGYLAIDTLGKVTGVGIGTDYYFSRRQLVGRIPEWPALQVEWDA